MNNANKKTNDIHDPIAYINAIKYVLSFQSFDCFAVKRIIKKTNMAPIK